MLQDKVIIVTGAGSGIGRATSRILAEAGANVIVADLSEEGARETEKLIVGEQRIASAFRVDVTSETEVKSMVDFALETYGRLDGAFNNAGIMMHSKLPDELEVDECFIGGKETNKHANKRNASPYGNAGKSIVVGMRQRGGVVVAKHVHHHGIAITGQGFLDSFGEKSFHCKVDPRELRQGLAHLGDGQFRLFAIEGF